MPASDPHMITHTHAAFRFVVDVGDKRQGVFTECTLPTVEWEVEEVKEGLNSYVHQLPGRRKAARITLKTESVKKSWRDGISRA